MMDPKKFKSDPHEYLRLKQEYNRIKRKMAEVNKDKEEERKRNLEKGFSVHFLGANAEKDAADKVVLRKKRSRKHGSSSSGRKNSGRYYRSSSHLKITLYIYESAVLFVGFSSWTLSHYFVCL